MDKKELCDVLLDLGFVTLEKLQSVYPDLYPPKTTQPETPTTPTTPPPVTTTGYRKIRMFNTDIHIYETSASEEVTVSIGDENKLEKLEDMNIAGKTVTCKINGGFYNFDGSREHLGALTVDEKSFYNYDNTYINYMYYKTGKTVIKYITNSEETFYFKYDMKWVMGVGWSLVNNGKKDLTNSDKFSHSKERHPRTMIGQLPNGNFVLVVADGRSTTSKGLTADEQAQVMLSLGCTTAVSLDGGGSSKMVVNNKVVNTPSEPNRKIGSAIFVIKK